MLPKRARTSVATRHMVVRLQVLRNGPLADKVGLLRMSAKGTNTKQPGGTMARVGGQKPLFLGTGGFASPVQVSPISSGLSGTFKSYLKKMTGEWVGKKEPVSCTLVRGHAAALSIWGLL